MSSVKSLLLLWIVFVACAGSGQEYAGRPADALSRYLQGQDCVHVWWRPLVGVQFGRRRSPHYFGPGTRTAFSKFSPDCKWIAFTGQYDGNFNVYIMPAQGGQPRQLTFFQGAAAPLSDRMGIHNELLAWTRDSKRIVLLSRSDASNGWTNRPFSVSIDGGLPEALPIDQGGLTSFSPDGTKIAYNPIFRNFRTWKRYTGGLVSPSPFTTSRTIRSKAMCRTRIGRTPFPCGTATPFISAPIAAPRMNLICTAMTSTASKWSN